MEATATAVEAVEQAQPRRKRSRAQRGSVIKRGETWTIVYRTPEGKQKWEGGFLKKDRAQARLDEVLGAIRNNKYVERTDQTFREFCDDSMEIVKHTLKPKTWVCYESVLKKWIMPKFGDWPICDITRPAVKGFVDALVSNRELGPGSVKLITRILHRFLEEALDREVIAVNPARKIETPNGNNEEVVLPTGQEIKKVLGKLPTVFQYLVYAGALTGARRGELLALRWGDIDWAKRSLHISKSIQSLPKKLLDGGTFRNVERLGTTGLAILSPKTKKAQRLVEIGPALLSLLRKMNRERNGCEFVFHDALGRPIDPDRASKIVCRARKEAGVEFHLHLLRHLHGSLLVEAGANIKQTQARLGHANASTTADIYTHVVTNEGHMLSEKVEAALPSVSLLLADEKPVALSPSHCEVISACDSAR